jgi:histidinol dehydrogenase
MKRLDWSTLDAAGRLEALARPRRRTETRVTDTVREIMDDVRDRGGAAVTDWSLKLDGAAPRRLELTADRVAAARDALRPADTRSIRMAAENIRIFHEATRPEDTPDVEIVPGVRSRLVWRPLRSAGLYVPGGSAPLFSSLLMLAIPAAVAGVGRRIAVTPPSASGEPHPAMIFAAAEAGLDELWLIGGAQAIAALTFGAELEDGIIAPCDKLFGPGNAWVAEAKKQASNLPGGPAVDMPAGPSELLVIADRDADPEIAAADLLSQAEHDADAQVILVSESRANIDAILVEVDRQLETLPRADIATETLAEGLRERGWEIEDVTAYRTVRAAPPPAETREMIKTGGFDAVCFTSSSTVRNLVGIAGKPHARTIVACIGPKTAETAAEFGLRVDVQPETAAMGPLVDALAEHAARLRAEGALPPPRKKSRRR